MTVSQQTWTSDPILTQEVKDQFSKAIEAYRADPHLITEHVNHEEQIRVGGYAHGTLLELVQNAADAMAGVTDDACDEFAGRVEIILDVANRTLCRPKSGESGLADSRGLGGRRQPQPLNIQCAMKHGYQL